MATNFPAALDDSSNLPNPAAGNAPNSPSHAGLHGNAQDAIKAIEAKLGITLSTPVANRLLLATGTGTTSWSQLTSAQLLAILTDETGTGSAVFNTTPTLVTPKMDTINEATASNGVTVAGLNIKSGVLSTSNAVAANSLAAGAVLAAKLGLSSAFTGGVTSYTNPGTGAGSFFYINLGGIKLIWGSIGAVATGGTGTLTYPSSFFTSVQCVMATAGVVAGTAAIETTIQASSSVAVTISLVATTGSGTMPVQVFAIGS